MKLARSLKQFNWRFLLVRTVVNALALAFTAAVVPKIYFVDKSIWNWILMALMLGVLNALLKPILQFLTLQFIFVTYGLVVVLVNGLLLWLLSLLFPSRFAVESILWLLVGGLVLGLLGAFLESLLGLTMPILPAEPADLRREVEDQARRVGQLPDTGQEVGLGGHTRAIEAPDRDTKVPEAAVPEAGMGEPAAAEPSTSQVSTEVEAEPSDSSVSPEADPGPASREEWEEG